MRKILEEILWNIYYLSSDRIGGRNDMRFLFINAVVKEIHDYTGQQLNKAVVDLKKENLIQKKKDYDGQILVSLTEKGVLRAINYKFRKLNYKSGKWDGKWRMIAFDIPRECEKGRKALVYRLKSGGFYRLQESIFLYPHDCKEELELLVNLFKIKKYVRFGLIDYIDNQDKIKFNFERLGLIK